MHKIPNATCRKVTIKHPGGSEFKVLEQIAFTGTGSNGDGVDKAGETKEEYINPKTAKEKLTTISWTEASRMAIGDLSFLL